MPRTAVGKTARRAAKPARRVRVAGKWTLADAAGGRFREIAEGALSKGPQRVTLEQGRSVLVVAEMSKPDRESYAGPTLREIMLAGAALGLELEGTSVLSPVRDVEL